MARDLAVLIWTMIIVIGPVCSVIAQEADPGEAGRKIRFRIDTGGSHQFETDIDGAGEFDVTRAKIGFGVTIPIGERLTMDNYLSYEVSDYDFSTPTALAGIFDPWSTIHTVRYRGNFQWTVDDQWSVFGGPIVGVSGEDGADFDEAITGGGMVGVNYRNGESFSIGVGVLMISQIEDDDAAVFPVITVNWRIDDAWTLRSGPLDLGSSGGVGLELAWAFAEKWELAMGAQYQTRRFRLKDVGVPPNGVGEETSVPIYTRLTWRFAPNATAYVFGGVVAGGELRLETSSGAKISEVDYDPAGIVGLKLNVGF